jgi:hypothetical protein
VRKLAVQQFNLLDGQSHRLAGKPRMMFQKTPRSSFCAVRAGDEPTAFR